MSHPGRNKQLEMMQRVMWCPSLYTIVRDVCLSCPTCQRYKDVPQVVAPPVERIYAAAPFELVAADLVVLPKSKSGSIGCLVVVDHFSKWAVIVPIRDKRGSTVATLLEDRVLTVLPQVPKRILTDNGLEFVSQDFENVLQKYSIDHAFTTPYCPSSNGAVERLNRTVLQMLRCDVSENNDWEKCLARVVLNYNNSVHASIGTTPSACILSGGHVPAGNPPENPEERSKWRSGHPAFSSFVVGDQVLKKLHLTGNLATNKLKPRYEGPFRVSTVNSNKVSYTLETPSGTLIRAHHVQLKRFTEVPHYLAQHPAYKEMECCQEELGVENQHHTVMRFFTDDESTDESSDHEGEASTVRKLAAKPPVNSSIPYGPSQVLTPHNKSAPDLNTSRYLFQALRNRDALLEESIKVTRDAMGVLESVEKFLRFHDNWMRKVEEDLERTLEPNFPTPAARERPPEYIIASSLGIPSTLVEASESDSQYPSSPSRPTCEAEPESQVIELEHHTEVSSQPQPLEITGDRTPPVRAHTRSQGPVPEYPNVQNLILEYKPRK